MKEENRASNVECVRFNFNCSGNVVGKQKRHLNHRVELNKFELNAFSYILEKPAHRKVFTVFSLVFENFGRCKN